MIPSHHTSWWGGKWGKPLVHKNALQNARSKCFKHTQQWSPLEKHHYMRDAWGLYSQRSGIRRFGRQPCNRNNLPPPRTVWEARRHPADSKWHACFCFFFFFLSFFVKLVFKFYLPPASYVWKLKSDHFRYENLVGSYAKLRFTLNSWLHHNLKNAIKTRHRYFSEGVKIGHAEQILTVRELQPAYRKLLLICIQFMQNTDRTVQSCVNITQKIHISIFKFIVKVLPDLEASV